MEQAELNPGMFSFLGEKTMLEPLLREQLSGKGILALKIAKPFTYRQEKWSSCMRLASIQNVNSLHTYIVPFQGVL